ncbi:hydroxyacid dehydrogenase [Thermus scotoductus]|uniref:hydroxyacid dehydrogenase n=1 Tax=Thermus scotoductus TaxID=37636 RepID=UPI00056E7F92|nr:hydroxyacid dehydrogenase [Thermus scotoductus]
MILVAEELDPRGLELLREGGHAYRYEPNLWRDPESLRKMLAEATALIVRNRIRVDGALLEGAPRLRVVGRLGTGLDNVDQEALRARNVVLVYAPGANALGVAEYVLAALFHLARNLPRAAQGGDRLALGGFELAGKTLGLVGLGEVGLRVAQRARALGMRVVGYDPLRKPWEAALEGAGVELLPLEAVFSEAHFLSLHAPPTPETRGLVNRRTLARMRPGAYLINTARGELVDHGALYEALREGHLAGAVLDVTHPEPLPEDHPLRGLETCLITPHIAGLTREAQARVGERVVQGVLEVLRAA